MNKTASNALISPTLEAAFAYYILGLSPIPIRAREKAAALPRGHEFLTRRATEEEMQGFDWSGNIGIVTGKLSGVVVLDVDGPEGMESLKNSGISLPDSTATAKTGKGFHIYFKYPEGSSGVKSRIGFLPGLDFKSDGGYVLAPPSTHPSGESYEWKPDPDTREPLSLESFGVEGLAEMPEDLLRLVQTPAATGGYRSPSKGSVSPSNGPVIEGCRNDTLTSIAGSLQARGVPDAPVRAILHSINETECSPPLEEREVEGIADSILRYEKGELRKAPVIASGVDTPPGVGGSGLLASRVFLDFDTPPEPPEMLHQGILFKGKRHIFYGSPGCGKSWVAAYLSIEAMNRGETVLYIDNENYAEEMRTRLFALEADPLAVGTLFVYLQAPKLGYDPDTAREYVEALDELKPDLVVFDSWVNFLTEDDHDENSNNDISNWSKKYLHPAAGRGITSVILDHTPHDKETPRGGSRKTGEVEVSWLVKKVGDFDQNKTGVVTLSLKKSRSGMLPDRHTFKVGGTTRGFIFEPKAEDGGAKLSGKRLAVFEFITENPGCRRSDIPGTVAAKQTVSEAVRELHKQGLILEEDGCLSAI